jgi:hypothetical protein
MSLLWTPERVAEARGLVDAHLGDRKKAAAAITSRWRHIVTVNALNKALRNATERETLSNLPASPDSWPDNDPLDRTDEMLPLTAEQLEVSDQRAQPNPALRPLESRSEAVKDPPEEPEPRKAQASSAARARVIHPPEGGLPLADLISHRIARYDAKARQERGRRLIPVVMPDDQPVGILHLGDPHLDDDGCDLRKVQAHAEIVRSTPGLYAACVGDFSNNWIGRLQALYGAQATTEGESWRLVEWFVRDLLGPHWLYAIGGNHDAWSGAGDPLQWICGAAGVLYQDSEVRLELRLPGGHRIRIHGRHEFKGRSMYNDTHAQMRALIFGNRDHMAISGHTHKSGYSTLKCPETGIAMHALQVAAYKDFDHYAREQGFPDKALGPCAVTVINPRLDPLHPDLVKVFWDPTEGADYLTFLRGRK